MKNELEQLKPSCEMIKKEINEISVYKTKTKKLKLQIKELQLQQVILNEKFKQEKLSL